MTDDLDDLLRRVTGIMQQPDAAEQLAEVAATLFSEVRAQRRRVSVAEAALAAQAATNAELLAALSKAQTLTRAWTEIGARADADAAAYRLVLQAVMHFWQSDPLSFGDEATPTSLAGRFGHIADVCAATLETTDAGASLLSELEAARAVVAAVRELLERDWAGGYWLPPDAQWQLTALTGAYDAAVRAGQRAASASPASAAGLVTESGDRERLETTGGTDE